MFHAVIQKRKSDTLFETQCSLHTVLQLGSSASWQTVCCCCCLYFVSWNHQHLASAAAVLTVQIHLLSRHPCQYHILMDASTYIPASAQIPRSSRNPSAQLRCSENTRMLTGTDSHKVHSPCPQDMDSSS